MAEKVDYIFPQKLNIQQMISFYKEISGVFHKKKKQIILDMTQLRTVDVGIIQILAVMIKEGLENDRNIILQGPLDPLLQDSLEEMDIIRSDSACPILFEQIQGGVKIEC